MWYNFWQMNRWLSLNFDVLGALIILITTLLSLSSWVEAGTAGLCITSAMSFSSSMYWACRNWTVLELDLNCVERLVEYLDLPQEPPAIIESNRPPAYWPSSNTKDALISVENLTIKYAPELPEILHNISFELKAKERIGLLGRTGKRAFVNIAWVTLTACNRQREINTGHEYTAFRKFNYSLIRIFSYLRSEIDRPSQWSHRD